MSEVRQTMTESNPAMTTSIEGTTDPDVIDARMPDSAKAVDFLKGFGRTYECRECGAPVEGKQCSECGHTPAQIRTDSGDSR